MNRNSRTKKKMVDSCKHTSKLKNVVEKNGKDYNVETCKSCKMILKSSLAED